MRSQADLSVDGQSFAMPPLRTPTLPEPTTTCELNECMRKLEKRESDFKRKERESAGHQAESLKWRKEHKIVSSELTSVRERNEQLQESLLGARTTIAAQTSALRDIEDSAQSAERLKKLESSLNIANSKAKSLEMEVEALKREPSLTGDSEVRRLEVLLRLSKQAEDKLNSEVTTLQYSNDRLKLENEQYEREIDDMRGRMTNSKNLVALHDEELERTLVMVADRNTTIARLQGEAEKLQTALLIRTETNLVLRGQLDELNDTAVAVGTQEGEKLLGLEADHYRLQQRSIELANTVAGHASLLRSMDAGRVQLKAQLDAANASIAGLTAETNHMQATTTADKAELKSLRKEINRVRNDNQEIRSQLDLRNVPLNREKELMGLHHTAAAAMREKQHGLEAAATEKKLKRIAEDSARSLHLRVCFLLEQLEQAAGLRNMWVEQKSILKAEVQALHKSNKLFRRQLLTLKNRDISENAGDGRDVGENLDLRSAHIMRVDSAFMTECQDPGSDPFGDSDNRNSDLNSMNSDEKSELLQTVSESLIEKAMFDMICAFSSASVASTVRRKRGLKPVGVYEIRQNECNLYELVYADSKGNNVEGDELLNALQMPMFFKLFQSRKDGKTVHFLADKLAQVLNFHRATTHEMYQQLCSGRMELAMLLSRIQNFKEQLSTAKMMYTRERVSKQTAIMKCVREQIQLSDIRVIIDDVSRKAAKQLDNEVENRKSSDFGKKKSDGRNTHAESQENVSVLLQQIAAVSSELSAVTVSSGTTTGPPGSMEISLQDKEIDDETLFGVMNVLKECSPDNKNVPMSDSGSLPTPSVCASLARMTDTGGLHLARILLLNLKGNHLTDISSKTLCALVECSSELRMLDLRGNSISPAGARLLAAAVARNPSVLQTTQRKGRNELGGGAKEKLGEILMVMVEGLREVVSRQPMSSGNLSGVTGPRHPLRIDLRHNVPQRGWKIAEDILKCTAHKSKNEVGERGELSVGGDRGTRRTPKKFDGQLGPIEWTGTKVPSRSVGRPKSADAALRKRGVKLEKIIERSRGTDSDFENVTREDDETGKKRGSDPSFDQLSGSASYKTGKTDGNRDTAAGARMGTDLLEWMGAGKEWDGDQGHQCQRARESRDRSDCDSGARNEEWNTDSNIDRTAKRRTFTGETLLRKGIAELVKTRRRPVSASASIRVRRASDSASANSGGKNNNNNAYNITGHDYKTGNTAFDDSTSPKNGKEPHSLFPDIQGSDWRTERAVQDLDLSNRIDWAPLTGYKARGARKMDADSNNLVSNHYDNCFENAIGCSGKKKRPMSATRLLKKASPSAGSRPQSASSIAAGRDNQNKLETKENNNDNSNSMKGNGYPQLDRADRGHDSRGKVPFPPDLSRIHSINTSSMSEMDTLLQEIHQQALNPALLF